MKAVVQRVSSASIMVDGKLISEIEDGLLVLLGIHTNDTKAEMEWMSEKILKLRIFGDEEGKMNKSVSDVEGEILLVSQFTLYGDAKKGTRPSYIEAGRPEISEPLYNEMIEYLKVNSSLSIKQGVFGADMKVSLVNDGPVTLILEK